MRKSGNITPETFSRKLAKLKNEKVIQNEKGYIKILDHEKLKDYISYSTFAHRKS